MSYIYPSLSQRYLFFLKLLTFIGKLSFWGVRWCVIVSTADFANDTPLLVRHVKLTELTPNPCNWLASNQIPRSQWPRPVWNTRPVNPQSTSHLFRLRSGLIGRTQCSCVWKTTHSLNHWCGYLTDAYAILLRKHVKCKGSVTHSYCTFAHHCI